MDTVILGCTHYPLVRPMLQRFLGRGVEIITSGAPLARQVEHVLGSRGLGSPQQGEGRYSFLCTGEDAEGFRALGTQFLQMPLGEVETVRFEEAAARPARRRRPPVTAAPAQRRPRARRAAADRRSSPASSAPPPARR